ncbi:MAG: TATA-box-binding protein [Candidatus Bathyarchaeia archaeon]
MDEGLFKLDKELVQVENVVASASLDHNLDLEVVSRVLPSGKYNPDEFPGVIYQLKNPKAAGLIFSSGKIVCAGAKSERQAKRALNKIVDELRMNGVVIVGKPAIKVQNVVASVEIGGTIDLEGAACLLERTLYDPEQFPGLILRMNEPPITFLLFSKGKIVCAGAKSEKDLYRGLEELEKILVEHELISFDETR